MKKIENLKIINKIILYLGIVSGIIIWIELLYIEVPGRYSYSSADIVFNLPGLILGLEVLLGSIVFWAVISVYCGIAEDVKASKKILEKNK